MLDLVAGCPAPRAEGLRRRLRPECYADHCLIERISGSIAAGAFRWSAYLLTWRDFVHQESTHQGLAPPESTEATDAAETADWTGCGAASGRGEVCIGYFTIRSRETDRVFTVGESAKHEPPLHGEREDCGVGNRVTSLRTLEGYRVARRGLNLYEIVDLDGLVCSTTDPTANAAGRAQIAPSVRSPVSRRKPAAPRPTVFPEPIDVVSLSHEEFAAIVDLIGAPWRRRRVGFSRLEIVSVADLGVEVVAEGWIDLGDLARSIVAGTARMPA